MAVGDKLPVVMGAEKAVAGGVATLDATGKLIEAQKPDYTGEEIPVSKTDGTSLSAALSNKANVYLDLSAVGLSGQVPISQVCAAMQDGRFFAAWNDTSLENCISDAPDTYTLITIYRAAAPYVICRAVRMSDGKEYVGTWNPNREPNWTGWVPQASATLPQEYDLPLASGLLNFPPDVSRYWKNQLGEVTVCLSAKSTGIMDENAVIATLPVGFRPAETLRCAGVCSANGVARPFALYVGVHGEIIASFIAGNEQYDGLFAEITFVAAN